jgi:hypothetical protein
MKYGCSAFELEFPVSDGHDIRNTSRALFLCTLFQQDIHTFYGKFGGISHQPEPVTLFKRTV